MVTRYNVGKVTSLFDRTSIHGLWKDISKKLISNKIPQSTSKIVQSLTNSIQSKLDRLDLFFKALDLYSTPGKIIPGRIIPDNLFSVRLIYSDEI